MNKYIDLYLDIGMSGNYKQISEIIKGENGVYAALKNNEITNEEYNKLIAYAVKMQSLLVVYGNRDD